MKVLLAGPDFEENLSIRYLSSSLTSSGHETILVPFNSAIDINATADAAEWADIAGLSICFQARAREFLSLAQRIKARDPKKLVVAGGHYASCAAEPLLANHPEIDIVVVHEGERTLVEIADAMPDLREHLPHIRGIAYRETGQVRFTERRPMLNDLDELPVPDRRGLVYWIAGVPTSYLMGSRGCYENCAYCCITTLHRMAPGKRFRQRKVERIADEMAVLYHERGTRQFIFHDDNFLVPSVELNHARLMALETALKSRGIRNIALVIKCRPADTKMEVLSRLKRLGLVRVFLGVESATEHGLATLERRQGVEDSERALRVCSELDISAQFTLMVFNPDTTIETLRSDVAFMRRFSANPLNFCRTEIYAGTPLEQRMIDCGRARGNYLAREYDLLHPAADLACSTALELFHSRCWSNGSLMQYAIGLDHAASVVKRFHKDRQRLALASNVTNWVRSVNSDTIRLLDELIELSASSGGHIGTHFRRCVRALREREQATRRDFLSEATRLSAQLQAIRVGSNDSSAVSSWPRLARKAAAALLAIGVSTTGTSAALAQEPAAASPAPAAGQDQSSCSMIVRITDPSGAVVPNSKITLTNEENGVSLTGSTGENGEFVANNLGSGTFTVKAEMAGFRTTERRGVKVAAGNCGRLDIELTLGIGCCEYVAVGLVAPNLQQTHKPFSYVVGSAKDKGTLPGIAKLVYGDSKAWLPIFDANRNVISKPSEIPAGTELLIPPQKRSVPKPIHKVEPVYPLAAKQAYMKGDVLLDVTLTEDGTVQEVRAVDGNAILIDAAISALKQWRYRPLVVNGQAVVKFAVLVSFGKKVTVH